MKSVTLAVSFAALAFAQMPNVPSCSLNCFVSALTSDGCSGLTDFACHCAKPALAAQVAPCVMSACPSASDQSSVLAIVSSECDAVGVPITVGLAVSDSSAAAATGTVAGGKGGKTGKGTAAAATGSVMGGASVASGAAGATATAKGTGKGGAKPSVASAASGVPAQFTGAADHNNARGAALGVGIAALVAAL